MTNEEYYKKLRSVVRTLDVKRMRDFAYKYSIVQDSSSFSDNAILIMMHKMRYMLKGIPENERNESKNWLLSNGYALSIFEIGSGQKMA